MGLHADDRRSDAVAIGVDPDDMIDKVCQCRVFMLEVSQSFFALLQRNVLDRRPWPTRQALRIAIVTWIERTYRRRRRQAALGRLTPIEYETIMTTPAAHAA